MQPNTQHSTFKPSSLTLAPLISILTLLTIISSCSETPDSNQPQENTIQLAPVNETDTLLPAKIKGKYGYVNTKGELVIAPIYDKAEFFSFGVAHVEQDKKHGFIDRHGKYVLPLQSARLSNFYCGRALKIKDKKYGVIDIHGNEIVPIKHDFISIHVNNRAIISDDSDKNENPKSEHSVIDLNGNEIVPFGKYSTIFTYEEGLAAAYRREDHRAVYLDTMGNEVLVCPPEWEMISSFSEGLASARMPTNIKNQKSDGYFNKQGKVVIPPDNWNWTRDFKNGFADVEPRYVGNPSEPQMYFIDTTGKPAFGDLKFDMTHGFKHGFAYIRNDDLGVALIDTTGNFVFEYGEYDYFEVIYPTVIKAYYEKEFFAYVRPSGEIIWQPTE